MPTCYRRDKRRYANIPYVYIVVNYTMNVVPCKYKVFIIYHGMCVQGFFGNVKNLVAR